VRSVIKTVRSLLALAVGPGAVCHVPAASVADYAVQVSATVQTNPPLITLSWSAEPGATDYSLYRKSRDDTSWGVATSLGANATNYLDSNVLVGTGYEYRINKTTPTHSGVGYLYAGIEVPLVEARGKVVLLVDNIHTSSLSNELGRLQQDLIGDGWTVLRHDVSRSGAVTNIKALITADYNADPASVKSVFLFGHVPVPYSGNLAPDGHPEHQGAWPADVYYGDVDGAWSDSVIDTTLASDPRNWNVPGDGKFDQTILPSDLELQVGRVDMANLPAFSVNETELLRRYLNKDHGFRHQLFTAERRGLIDDELGFLNGEVPAVNGWRNFAPFFGPANAIAGDWLTTLATQSFLWGYGCGAGDHTSCSGVATAAELADSDQRVVFTMFFGSYFGDWDSQNNFMRAALATTNYTLTSAWVARPHWHFHHMALGETIGFSALLSQNNSGVLYSFNSDPRRVHIALMGDPALRMHIVAPPTNLVAVANGSGGVDLNWGVSPDSVLGYQVYRATNAAGPYTRLNNTLVSGSSYTDAAPTATNYMVRAVKLEVSGSGSYYNASQGIFQDLAGTYVPPVLSLSATAGGVGLSWPADRLGYHLEAAASLSPASNWLSVTNSVQTSNGLNIVLVNFSGSNRFFRLRQP
jgi:hypothetical protein